MKAFVQSKPSETMGISGEQGVKSSDNVSALSFGSKPRLLLEEIKHNKKKESVHEPVIFAHDFSQIPLHSADADISQSQPGFVAAPAVPIQCKSILSSPNDPFEREADEVANKVMEANETRPVSRTQPKLQFKCEKCEEEENLSAKASLQTIEGGKEEKQEVDELPETPIQRKAETGVTGKINSNGIMDRLSKTKSGGEILAYDTRNSMEMAFGHDFSRVRIHNDSEAAALSHELSAQAFTHVNHIYFAKGRYEPGQSYGKRLLAHELTHVVQQGAAGIRSGKAQAAATAQTGAPAIQRAATWNAAAVHETNNLADTALFGNDAGVTVPQINGARGGALNAPTIAVSPVAAGGFDARVTAVAANAGNVDETVLSPGPWRRTVPKATIRARFASLAQCTGAGNSRFRARGNPSDAAMQAANRRHEDHHGADGLAAFTGSVIPWDARLTAANAAGTTFHGATEAAARAALFTAMGGNEIQVTNAFIRAWNAAIPVFHATPAGGPIGAPTDPNAADDCSWSFARFTNPS